MRPAASTRTIFDDLLQGAHRGRAVDEPVQQLGLRVSTGEGDVDAVAQHQQDDDHAQQRQGRGLDQDEGRDEEGDAGVDERRDDTRPERLVEHLPVERTLGQADGCGHGAGGDEVGDQHRHEDGQPAGRGQGVATLQDRVVGERPEGRLEGEHGGVERQLHAPHACCDDEREDGADDVRRDVLLRRKEGQAEHRRYFTERVPVRVALRRQVNDHDLGEREERHQDEPREVWYRCSRVLQPRRYDDQAGQAGHGRPEEPDVGLPAAR